MNPAPTNSVGAVLFVSAGITGDSPNACDDIAIPDRVELRKTELNLRVGNGRPAPSALVRCRDTARDRTGFNHPRNKFEKRKKDRITLKTKAVHCSFRIRCTESNLRPELGSSGAVGAVGAVRAVGAP